ncbi:hypothetical protein GN286_15110 [Rhodobacteraceae bacterium IMCC15231]|nr:hypothetical protein [Rhodobacteraceae bacterium IMCC15231]
MGLFHWPDQAKRFERLLTQQKNYREQSFAHFKWPIDTACSIS